MMHFCFLKQGEYFRVKRRTGTVAVVIGRNRETKMLDVVPTTEMGEELLIQTFLVTAASLEAASRVVAHAERQNPYVNAAIAIKKDDDGRLEIGAVALEAEASVLEGASVD